jgi:hypothetical protein
VAFSQAESSPFRGPDLLEHRVQAADRLGEDPDAGIEHVEHARRQRALGPEGVDGDLAQLPDAIDAADPLLDGRRAPGEVVVDQHVAVLEVAPFPAQLGAEEHAGPLRVAEAGHQLVAVGGRQVAHVGERLDAFLLARAPGEPLAQVVDGLARLGEDQHLLVRQRAREQRAEGRELRVCAVFGERRGLRRELPQARVLRGG